MADFIWLDSVSNVTISIEGAELVALNILDTSNSVLVSVEGSVGTFNAVGEGAMVVVSSVSGQFVPSYIGLNTFRWSALGKVDFNLGYDNTAGWKMLEWAGSAYKCLRFKNSVIVYGSGGISALFPVNEPVITWSEFVLDNIGILGKQCAVDTADGHYFLGKDFQLYTIVENSQSLKSNAMPVIKLLGFKEFIKQLTGTIKMFYEPVTKVVYISGGNKTFTYSMGELTELDTSIAGAVYTDKLYQQYAVAPSGSVIMRTQELRFSTVNYKTIRSIAFDLDMHLVTDPICTVWTRDKTTKLFTVGKSCKVNPNGVAFPRITSEEFQIQISFVPLSRLAVRSMQITVQFSDKRFGYGGQDVKQITA